VKGIFLTILGVARWVRDLVIYLSVFPLCIYTTYLQSKINPTPMSWPWLDAQQGIVFAIALLDACCLLWFFIEKIRQGQKGWWTGLITISVGLYSVILLWLMQIAGDHNIILARTQAFALVLLAFFGPFFTMMHIQWESETKKRAAKKAAEEE
jgi:hypothetical protein